MASNINISALTLAAEEATEVSQLILEREFVNGALSQNHDIHTGILYKTQIPFAGKLSDAVKKSTGCTPNAGGAVALSQKYWDPEIFDVRFTHCAADLSKLFKLFQKESRINPDYFNKDGSQEMAMIYSLVAQMLRETLPVKVWFSDTAADDVDGSGVFTSGTDLDLYNVFDGLFKQLFASITDGSTYHVDIAKNAGANYAAQALAADDAYNTLLAMRNKADERLLEDPAAKFYITRSLADNYRDTLRTKTLTAGFIEITENGKSQLMFDGIPVEVMYVWDRTIKALQDNETKWNIPHRALLTTPDNIPVGTVAESDFETLDSFYDKTLKSNITDVAFSLDAKFLETYMAVFAY
tara:strand:+ start:13022 stop:14083 length:1062 start_codon:yes stop_codon:yes gene_type:complete